MKTPSYIADVSIRPIYNDLRDWFVMHEEKKKIPTGIGSLIVRVVYENNDATFMKRQQFEVGIYPLALDASLFLVHIKMRMPKSQFNWAISYVGLRFEVHSGTMGYGTMAGRSAPWNKPNEECDVSFKIDIRKPLHELLGKEL